MRMMDGNSWQVSMECCLEWFSPKGGVLNRMAAWQEFEDMPRAEVGMWLSGGVPALHVRGPGFDPKH